MVLHPSGSDGNGDFVQIKQATIYASKRLLSVSHTQSRSTRVGYVAAGHIYEVFSTNTHGLRLGQIGDELHVSVSGLIQLGSLGSTAVAGPIKLHGYCEAGYRLLEIEGGTAVEEPIVLERLKASFELQDSVRGTPRAMIGPASGAASLGLLKIQGGSFKNFHGAFVSLLSLEIAGGAFFDPADTGAGAASSISSYLCAFQNGTAGGLIDVQRQLPYAPRCVPHHSRFFQRNIDTGGSDSSQIACHTGIRQSSRKYCLPALVSHGAVRDDAYSDTELVANPHGFMLYDKATFSAVSTSGSGSAFEWTFTNPQDPYYVETRGGATGDVLIDASTGMTFVVRSYVRSTGATIARALSNFRKRNGVWAPIITFAASSGLLYTINTRRFLPNKPIFGSFTSGSAAVSAVASADGTAVDTDTIAVGDWIYQNPRVDSITSETGARIAAFDSVAKTLSIAGNATRTVTRRLAVVTRTVPNG